MNETTSPSHWKLNGTGSVISLAEFRNQSTNAPWDSLLVSASNTNVTNFVSFEADERQAGGVLSAQVLRKLNPDSDLARLFDVTSQIVQEAEECEVLLNDSQNIEADARLLSIKVLLTELFMFRDLSEAAGIVSFSALECISKVATVTDSPNLVPALANAFKRLWAAPFMPIGETSSLCQSMERAVSGASLPGYDALVAELLGNCETSKK